MADEDLAGARALVGISTRLARYHVQQSDLENDISKLAPAAVAGA
jgi:hypothetical protein